MAGGTFDKLVGKVRPGTYINFVSTKHDTVGISSRGIVIIPLTNHNYGPVGEFITLDCRKPRTQLSTSWGTACTTATTTGKCFLSGKR